MADVVGVIRGQVFGSREETRVLPDGHGVVLTGNDSQGFTAYDESMNVSDISGKNRLRHNLAGARMSEAQAILVVRLRGKLIWGGAEAEIEIAPPQKPVYKKTWRDGRLHFDPV